MQPGAGTTVERQVAGEFGDRSPVLKPNQTKPKKSIYLVDIVGGGDRPVWISMVQRGSREWLNHDAEMNCHDGLTLAQDGSSVD